MTTKTRQPRLFATPEDKVEYARVRRACQLANDALEIKRLRRLLENPRRNYWKKFTDEQAKKRYERIRTRAGLVDERMYNAAQSEV